MWRAESYVRICRTLSTQVQLPRGNEEGRRGREKGVLLIYRADLFWDYSTSLLAAHTTYPTQFVRNYQLRMTAKTLPVQCSTITIAYLLVSLHSPYSTEMVYAERRLNSEGLEVYTRRLTPLKPVFLCGDQYLASQGVTQTSEHGCGWGLQMSWLTGIEVQ